MINHGTTGGYYAHRRLQEPPCEPCREAVNKYLREYRATKGRARTRVRDKIRRKALTQLRRHHIVEYNMLVDTLEMEMLEEIAKAEERDKAEDLGK